MATSHYLIQDGSEVLLGKDCCLSQRMSRSFALIRRRNNGTNPFFLFPCFVLKLLKWKNEDDTHDRASRLRSLACTNAACRNDFCARAVPPTNQPIEGMAFPKAIRR